MNSASSNFDLEKLNAYLDGELDEVAANGMKAYLENHPEARRVLAEYRSQDDTLRAALAGALTEPVPDRFDRLINASGLDPEPHASPGQPPFWRKRLFSAAATGVLALAIGVFAGWNVRGNLYQMEAEKMAIDMFLQQATNSYSMFAGGERSWGTSGLKTDRGEFAEWFKSALDINISTPNFDDPSFQFVGGRALPVSSHGAAGQILYENEQGQMVAVYFQVNQSDAPPRHRLRRNGSTGTNGAGQTSDLPATFVERNDLSVYYWQSESSNTSYAIMGDIDRDALSNLARAILDQFGN